MCTFQAVGILLDLESGMTKDHIKRLLLSLPDDKEFVQFDVSENNSTIWGFMTVDCADDEDHYASIIATCKELCNDFDNERTDSIYTTKSGIEVYVSCESKTVRDDQELRRFSSEGNFVTVKTKEQSYEHVIICPKPYSPWKHLIEASNGDVIEIKTADILSVQ